LRSGLRRLDNLLVERGMAETRTRARELVLEGRIRVPGKVDLKPATLLPSDAPLQCVVAETWVSRGAHKLLAALDRFGLDPTGATCLDAGASTGGFTQVLLSRGAGRVYAVDVGYGQLAWVLRSDPRVVVRERTNARHLRGEDFPEPMDWVVCDASFISLRLLLPPLAALLSPGGRMVALLKPQFEAGPGRVGKRGVVRDPEVHRDVLESFSAFVETEGSLRLVGAGFSPIRGPEGNIEFLLNLTKDVGGGKPPEQVDFAALVDEAHREAR
jgi:23S rRNA (cytidine1920-2'-O)/16S rRNA (cytidine1409-2'-O)-methyltransferase